MSRIGKMPVNFGKEVQINIGAGNTVTVKGAKTSLSYKLNPAITAKVEGGLLTLARANESKKVRALHGLYRALLNNAVTGVTQGFTKILDINGVGYKANVAGKKLQLNLGFTHDIDFDIPTGIEIKVEKNTRVIVSGADRNLVGLVAAKIRGFKEPEPYQGKGIKYDTETIRRKAGKSVSK
ncbi:MAG: 50S ribosomal protein L6 [Oligoflexia bacterium]|nr:50S ribosomal protein L6 [Oligoflexia bacterium]